MKKKIFRGVGICIIVVLLFSLIPKEVENCPLHRQTNPPVLINTSTGSAYEIRLFQTLTTDSRVIVEVENYGYMQMGMGDGWHIASFPDNHYTDINMETNRIENFSLRKAKKYFCSDCIAAIKSLNPTTNFVFADCLTETLTFYDLKEVEKEEGLNIRHYILKLNLHDEYSYNIKMVSSYFDGGKELDE